MTVETVNWTPINDGVDQRADFGHGYYAEVGPDSAGGWSWSALWRVDDEPWATGTKANEDAAKAVVAAVIGVRPAAVSVAKAEPMTKAGRDTVMLVGEIPVYVVVDLDARSIKQVVADCESFRFTGEFCDKDGSTIAVYSPGPVDDLAEIHPDCADALRIADDVEAEWPSWSWGW